MTYLLFIIEQRKKWNDNVEKIKKIEDEIKSISDSKPVEQEEIDLNKKKIEDLQKDLNTLRTLQNNYSKAVMDKEKELEDIYNKERKDLEVEISLSKNLDKKEESEEKNPTENQ
jgi:chromosome segregation ATPase